MLDQAEITVAALKDLVRFAIGESLGGCESVEHRPFVWRTFIALSMRLVAAAKIEMLDSLKEEFREAVLHAAELQRSKDFHRFTHQFDYQQ